MLKSVDALRGYKIAAQDGEIGSVADILFDERTSAARRSVSKGSPGGPEKGALISATDRNTSGRSSAHQAATGEPKS